MEEQDYSIFISHAAVDEEIAGSVKEFIGKAFPRERVFVSSDPEDLKLGYEWVDKILEALKSTKFVLVLTTKRGLNRKWVWFEAGRTWFSGVPLLPCCVGEVRKGNLPAPFSQRMAANIDDSRDVKVLFDRLREQFGELAEVPDCEEFARMMGRLEVRAEEKAKIIDDPFAVQVMDDIDKTMKRLSPAEQESIKQFAIYEELSAAGAWAHVNRSGVNMDRYSVPSHLMQETGWLIPKPGNSENDFSGQNVYIVNSTVKPHLRAYFLRRG